MRILHFITNLNYSSWVYKLHINLNSRNGIQSTIICLKNNTDDSNIYELSNYYKKKAKTVFILERLLFLFKKKIPFSASIFSVNIFKDAKVNELINTHDIINIHWINNGFLSIADIVKINNLKNKKVIWRLYDSWAFTGGCHVRMKCDNFENSCGNCMNLKYNFKHDPTKFLFNYKKRMLADNKFNIVVPSKYIKEQVDKSSFYIKSHISVINNGIDKVMNLDKSLLRKKYKLNNNKKYILFGATNINLIYKGMDYLYKALNLMSEQEKGNIEILTFGNFSDNTFLHSFIVHNFGFVTDKNKLMEIFNLADIFVGPSIEESFGNVFLESLSCGTPCVVFDEIGAATDIIIHKENGYIAQSMNYNDLYDGIVWTLDNADILKDSCIETVNRKFIMNFITDKYLNLYKGV